MEEELRKTGIDVLGDVPWGTHFCQFYETKNDLLDILVPYFRAGVENNEFCLWIISDPLTVENAFEAMQQAIPHFNRFHSKGDIEILSYKDWYLKKGEFHSKEVINEWYNKLHTALEKGYAGMRVNGNESWLQQEHWKNFMSYEKELNHSLDSRRILVLCTYPLAKSEAATILDVASAHEQVICKRNGCWEILEYPEVKEMKAQLKKMNEELEQRVAERTYELKMSETRYRALVEQASDAILITDRQGNLTEVNTSFCSMFGYSKEELIGMNMIVLVDPEQVKTDPLRFDLLFAGEALYRERRMKKRDGTIFEIEEHVKMLPDGRILAIVRDITERKNSEEILNKSYRQIRSLTEHLQNIREEERKTIAREIHDELGQQLTVLKMDVSWLTKKLALADEPIKEKLKDLLELLHSTVQSVRRISYELRPSMLDDLGLAAAMEWHLKEFEKRSGVKTTLLIDEPEPSLPDDITTGLFRILQESLTNVARHAHAQNVEVSLHKKEGQVILRIEDDGKGFDIQTAGKKRTLGILGMEERAAMMGGVYTIESARSKGTTVMVAVPLKSLV